MTVDERLASQQNVMLLNSWLFYIFSLRILYLYPSRIETFAKSVHFTKQFYGFRQQFPRKIAFMKCCCTIFVLNLFVVEWRRKFHLDWLEYSHPFSTNWNVNEDYYIQSEIGLNPTATDGSGPPGAEVEDGIVWQCNVMFLFGLNVNPDWRAFHIWGDGNNLFIMRPSMLK